MRSARHGLNTIIATKAPSNTRVTRKNMRPFTPPKNKMPNAMAAMTMNAPMSGSASSSKPITASAMAMGVTARRKFSFTPILRTM